jgi:hypothetical protein
MGEAPEALILVGCPPCVMEAVAYGRKIVRVAVKWDTARLAFGWSWRMAQVVPPQYEVGQGSEIRNSVRGSKEIWECLGVMTLRSLWFALLGTTLNMWECPP